MKYLNNRVWIALVCMTVFVSSCTDKFTDLGPTSVLAENLTFQSMADVELQLVGTYSALLSGSYMGTNMLIVPDILADNATQTSDNQGQQIFYHNHQYAANDGSIAGTWLRMYVAIERANITLEEALNFEEEFEGQQDQIMGQAFALRALAHFDLLRAFGPSFDNGAALGVPIKIKSREATAAVSRATVGEVLAQIDSDLLEARTLLTDNDPGNAPYRINIDVANALSARVALYNEEWLDASTFATAAIGTRSLATGTDFADIWTLDDDGNGTGGELLWSLNYTSADAAVGNGLWSETSDLLFWSPSANLVALYDDVNDARYSSYFLDRPSNTAELVDGKYRGRAPGGVISNFGLHDVKMFRLSEMYLIRAEADFELNGTGGTFAAADVNAIRAARVTGHVDEVFASSLDLENGIQNERRKELAFEGHRWFDLKRRGESLVRGSDCDSSPAVNCSLVNTDYHWLFPIPQGEIFASDIAQNDNY